MGGRETLTPISLTQGVLVLMRCIGYQWVAFPTQEPMSSPAHTSASALKVLFIGGKGRSGSTILDLLLGRLPGYFPVGELRRIWARSSEEGQLCGCGQPFKACPFWGEVGQVAFGGWDRVDAAEMERLNMSVNRNRFLPWLAAPSLDPHFERRLRRYTQVLAQLLQAVRQVSGCQVLVDSSKAAGAAMLMRRVPGLDVKIVQLIRDSRGVAYSRTKRVRRPEITSKEVYMGQWHPAKTALKWASANALYETLRLLGVPSQRLIYEDLIARPRQVLQALLRQADLPLRASDLDFLDDPEIELGTHHTVSGNPLRLKHTRVRLRMDNAWQEKLPAAHRALVTALTAPMLASYGYLGQGLIQRP
jgi:hypothetical protein